MNITEIDEDAFTLEIVQDESSFVEDKSNLELTWSAMSFAEYGMKIQVEFRET